MFPRTKALGKMFGKEMINVKTDHKTTEYMVFRLITESNASLYNGNPKELQFVLSMAGEVLKGENEV